MAATVPITQQGLFPKGECPVGDFHLKVLGENVEVRLQGLNTAELIKMALVTLAKAGVAEQVPHQALPKGVTGVIEGGEEPDSNLRAEIAALREEHSVDSEEEQEIFDSREGLKLGDVELRCESRRWTIHAEGQDPGTFEGSLLLFAELMAYVTRDVAVEDSSFSWGYRPWVCVREKTAWSGVGLAEGQPRVPGELSEGVRKFFETVISIRILEDSEVPAWARAAVEQTRAALIALSELASERELDLKPCAIEPTSLFELPYPQGLVLPSHRKLDEAQALLDSNIKLSELRAMQEHLDTEAQRLRQEEQEFMDEVSDQDDDVELRLESAVRAEELALRT